MKIQYDPDFLKILKKINVRIRKSLRIRIEIFLKNPSDPQLNNHKLKDEYAGYWSIDITADYRVIYEEINEGNEPVAYFLFLNQNTSQLAAGMNGSQKNFPQDTPSALLRSSSLIGTHELLYDH